MSTRSFAHFVAIDWSGARGERQKGIAIAICEPGTAAPTLVQRERHWSRGDVLGWLVRELPREALVGMDLSPSLPFVDEAAFFPGWAESPADAKALWRHVDTLCAETPHLAACGFVANAEARRHFRHGKDDCGDCFVGTQGRLRETERRQTGPDGTRTSPSSCFNLVGAAQVGKSSLTGMRLFHRLEGRIPIWPFDPLPEIGSVIVEIYTSLAARAAGLPKGRAKMTTGAALDAALAMLGVSAHVPLPRYSDHATDAILTAAWLRANADRRDLWHPQAMSPEIARTEGWTFGVA